MIIPNSVLTELLHSTPAWRSQIYFKSSLVALSHAMEDQVLAGNDSPLVIASFQRERFYLQETHRYKRIAERSDHVYVLSSQESDFHHGSDEYETIAFDPQDGLSQEWHLIVIGKQYASCLICREKLTPDPHQEKWLSYPERRFEGIWTFDRHVSSQAALILLNRILQYRPELETKIKQAKRQFLTKKILASAVQVDPNPFIQRLVTYIQASQYKLLKTYRTLANKEKKERLVNSISNAIRQSLHTDEILEIAVQELGITMPFSRCLIYRCKSTDSSIVITHQFLQENFISVLGEKWVLAENSLFNQVWQTKQPVHIIDTDKYAEFNVPDGAKTLAEMFNITSWLMVPILYQDKLLGMIELHHCEMTCYEWQPEQIELVEAIAAQIGTALIQAESYSNLEDLTDQLEALDRTRSNLVAITGHELRTPLSTIQVCLESLASEPDMPAELRQVMLNSALEDAERMRKLIQDFLTLSRLESGRVEWHPEALSLQECIDLALSSIHARYRLEPIPKINVNLPLDLPLVRADGEWLVEVLSKLLDNACKFTPSEGLITIETQYYGNDKIEVLVIDNGRGIEGKRLETVFERFYQEEGALRRTAGGTGLGLAICRQIVNNWGGQIWAESIGKDQGSKFHFTLPIFN